MICSYPAGHPALDTNLSSAVEQLLSWLPVDAVIENGRPVIEWIDVGEAEFREPFFHETIGRLKSRRKVVTEPDVLLQLEKFADCIRPTGFIFHSSRCGSTLLANACRALNDSLVIAEAPVIDKLASRFFTDADPGSSKELLYMLLLRATIALLGQRRGHNYQRYFVKFACTTTLQIERIRRIWPSVPFVFLYRDPVEIVVSNLKAIPQWMQPQSNPATAAAIIGVEERNVTSLSHEEFCARTLGRFFQVVLDNRSNRTRVINYSLVSDDWLIEAMSHFGLTLSAAEVDAISKVSRLYSKDLSGNQPFVSDSILKKASATDYIIQLVEKWSKASYEKLNIVSSTSEKGKSE